MKNKALSGKLTAHTPTPQIQLSTTNVYVDGKPYTKKYASIALSCHEELLEACKQSLKAFEIYWENNIQEPELIKRLEKAIAKASEGI